MPGTINDLVTLQRGTTYQSALLERPGPYLLGLASIARDGGFRYGNLKTYGGESPEKLLLRPGDIYVSLKDVTQSGDVLGAVSRVPDDISLGRLTQDTLKLIPRNPNVNVSYLYWVLRTPAYRDFCRSRAIGTTNLSLSREDFLGFEIPDLSKERLAVLSILESIESKIDINRRLNTTLDAMARSIFKNSLKETCKEQRLEDLCEIFDGPHATPKTVSQGPIFLGISNLSDGLLDLSATRHVTEQDFKKWTKRVTPTAGDIVFSYETRLGEAARIPKGLLCCLGRRMGLLRPKTNGISSVTLLYAYLSSTFQDVIRARTIHGSTVDRIPLIEMGEFPILVPATETERRIAPVLESLRERMEQSFSESRTLASLRDLLLPKLMSGELQIRAVEKAVASAL
ncbi:restriction endonuclease subunit S [Azospirillum rugosum]|uniref:Type I restriction enzyme S subunit n=1 Tax=Azospirillum rugosum TaxID=416170 RepID=A0ABS4SX23_9PROT|nr:restriction endonuclease subunit S [Azospirillum rugosum]MBP2297099.1 type I restriction enzyme S subunit [Azospirillum rugosum]MDQ0530935.1 type I restriction enzyme S subunit [Azospirillum rugosum]